MRRYSPYDRYGNRLSQTVTAGTGPSVSLAFTTNNRPSGYTYDAAGNLIVEPLSPPNDYSYDQENRLITLSGNSGSAAYAYDDNDQRVVITIQGGTKTEFVYSGRKVIAEYDNGASPSSPSREYIYGAVGPNRGLGPDLIAKIDSNGTQYYHQDHLSVRLMTDSTGNKIGEQGHYPFGEQWYASNTTTKWVFTTYERDLGTGNNSGLDYAVARFYNSRVASFCSVDPIEGRPDDPQSWNRYSYAENDPINMVDPSGKGLFGWLFEIFLIIVQVLSGAPTAALALSDVGATGPPIILLPPPDLMSNAIQQAAPPTSSKEGQGQSQTQQTPPAPPPRPGAGKNVYCDPVFLQALQAGWQRSNQGKGSNTHGRESGTIFTQGGNGNLQATAHDQVGLSQPGQGDKIVHVAQNNEIAFAHNHGAPETHMSQAPTPGTDTVEKTNPEGQAITIYTSTADGLWESDGKGGSIIVLPGWDWLSKHPKNCR